MDKPKLLEALAALPESGVKRTKTGRLRELLPEIEAAQAAGYANEVIAKALTEQGLEVSKRTLETMLSRIRKEIKKERGEGAIPSPATRPPVSSAGQPTTAQGAAKAADLDERKVPAGRVITKTADTVRAPRPVIDFSQFTDDDKGTE